MNKVRDVLLGVAIGDALGVPVEFKSRLYMYQNPLKDMIGYKVHNQPAGTWSDDSSLTFCLAENLVHGYDLADLSKRFIDWKDKAYWTAHNEIFDMGITTGRAIEDLHQILWEKDYGRLKSLIYEGNEYKNGNGSLMRIAPLLFYIKDREIAEQFDIIKEVSALTHRHIRSAICCLIYLKYMEKILEGFNKKNAYEEMQKEVSAFLKVKEMAKREVGLLERILENNIHEYPENEINSSGYVLHSLEASIWCLLNSNSYEETVLMAVNLGMDTDTTAAIAGGLAGLLYGAEAIPNKWLTQLARLDDIEDLAERLNKAM